jgi:hypothetical protein
MRAIKSDGRTSDFVVLNARTGEIVSDVLVMFPLHDCEAAWMLSDYVNGLSLCGEELPELKAWSRHLTEIWKQREAAKAWETPEQSDKK